MYNPSLIYSTPYALRTLFLTHASQPPQFLRKKDSKEKKVIFGVISSSLR